MNLPRRSNLDDAGAAQLKIARARLSQLLADSSLENRELTGLPPDVAGPLALSQLCSVCQTVGFLEGIALADRYLAEQLLDQVDQFAELLDRLGELSAPLRPLVAPDSAEQNRSSGRRERPRHAPPITADRRVGDRRRLIDRRADPRRGIA